MQTIVPHNLNLHLEFLYRLCCDSTGVTEGGKTLAVFIRSRNSVTSVRAFARLFAIARKETRTILFLSRINACPMGRHGSAARSR